MLSLASLLKHISDHNPGRIPSAEFKATLFFYVLADSQFSDEKCINGLQQDLVVEILFQPDVLRGPRTIFRILRDFLTLKEFTFEMALGSNRVTTGIYNCFFTHPGDR